MPALGIQTNQSIELEKQAEVTAATPAVTQPDMGMLASYLRNMWGIARRAKQTDVNTRLEKSLRARNGEYEPSKLAAIQSVMGPGSSPIYMKLTETKCRAAESWIRDALFKSGQLPFSLKSTPLPELPKFVRAQVESAVKQAVVQQAVEMSAAAGQIPDYSYIRSMVDEMVPAMQQDVEKAIRKKAKQAAEEMQRLIEDQFREGGWEQAVDDSIFDLVTYGTGIITGPIIKRQLVLVRDVNPATGIYESRVERRDSSTYERVNPWDFYPSPDSTARSIPWYCRKVRLTRKGLSDMIGVKTWNEKEIRAVLSEHRDGGLREWTETDVTQASLEKKDTVSINETQMIDGIYYWGTAPGAHLIDWGLAPESIQDPDKEYSIVAWLIGTHCVKAMLNPNPLGKIDVYSAGFSDRPDSFWRVGVPELVEHIQNLVNAVARAIVHNIGVASGPQVEVDTTRLADDETATIYPWKVWKSTSQGMIESPAVRFYMPGMVTDKLIQVFELCMRMADDETGIPRYIHTGETRGGGAGETASGLSMLMSHASKGIQSVLRNVDRGIIIPSVEAQYNYNLTWEGGDEKIIGDIKIVAKGSNALVAKEQQIIRRAEFLQQTNNAIDPQLLGLRSRLQLLVNQARDLGDDIDIDEVEAQEREINAMASAGMAGQPGQMGAEGMNGVGPGGGPPNPKQKSLDAAGGEVAGRDNQEFESQEGVRP